MGENLCALKLISASWSAVLILVYIESCVQNVGSHIEQCIVV